MKMNYHEFRIKEFATVTNNFPNIPNEEQKKAWFLLWIPIIKARLTCQNSKESPLLKRLETNEGLYTWQSLKIITEFALTQAKNADQIFTKIARKIEPDVKEPDEIINEMFAELKAIPFLKQRGFENLVYQRENSVDFQATLNGERIGIEVTYVHGPSFKTQKIDPEINQFAENPIYTLTSKKLINRLKSIYDEKEKQVLKHGYTASNAIIIIFTHLLEVYQPWLNHVPIDGKHVLQYFVDSCEIPTMIFGPGCTLYEPIKLAKVLPAFDRNEYVKMAYGIDSKAAALNAESMGFKLEETFHTTINLL
jgi:hypothetical protein